MEIRARYFLIGLFVLAVIAVGVGFVYWIYNTGGLNRRTDYLVSIEGSVSGLAPGSPVLFNGLQVGEVTGLTLSLDQPNLVIAHISIDARTPVRTDTRVGMDFRGLTGTATIALTGGSAGAPAPEGAGGGPPLLVADPSAIKDMTTSAREALTKLNDLLQKNAGPVTDAIANVDTFAQALARNSDKIDSIVAGLDKMVGGGDKPEPISYDLAAPAKFPDIAALPEAQLVIEAPTTVVALDTQRIMMRTGDGIVPVFANSRWADSIPLLVQARLKQGFENAGDPRVGTDTSGLAGDFKLYVDIRRFDVESGDNPTAHVAMMAKIADSGDKVIDAKLFEGDAPVSDATKADAAAAALDAAFGKAATDLTVWALGAISSAEAADGGDAPPLDTPAAPDMPAMPDMPAPSDAKAPAAQ